MSRQVRVDGPIRRLPALQVYSTVAPTSYALPEFRSAVVVTVIVEFGGCSGRPHARGSNSKQRISFFFFLLLFTWLKLLAIFMFSDGKGIMVDHNLWFIVGRTYTDDFFFFLEFIYKYIKYS